MDNGTAAIRHRTDTGRYYRRIPIHAAAGVHESVARALARRRAPGEHVLELGAGSGALTCRLTDLGYTVVAVDRDAADWRCPAVRPVLLDLNEPDWPQRLPRPRFPAVLAVEIIEHLENPRQFLRGLFQVTATGGLCVVTTPNVLCADSINRMVRLGSFYGFDETQYFESGHISILPDWLLRLFAEEAGFRVLETCRVGLMDKRGWKRAVTRGLDRCLRLLRPGDGSRVEGDGIISMLVATREDRPC